MSNKDRGPLPGLLRTVALIAVVIGAVGSLVLMFRADERTPRFLLVIFVFWVASPFVALAWANLIATRWSALTQATLYGVTVIITLGTLACYGKLILPPVGSPRAFMFVAVPPASWLFMTIAISIAALMARNRSQRGTGG